MVENKDPMVFQKEYAENDLFGVQQLAESWVFQLKLETAREVTGAKMEKWAGMQLEMGDVLH
jgi:hypothetical protein